MGRFRFEAEGDVEGHAAKVRFREVDVDRMQLRTADGDELTLEPDGQDPDRWKVVEGPDDLIGHACRPGR
jgi:hypothetical protein